MRSLPIAALLIRRTLGSRRGILMNLLLPAVVLGLVVGLFASQEDTRPVVALYNADAGPLGTYAETLLQREKLYDIRTDMGQDDASLRQAVADGRAHAAVYVPSDFSRRLAAGERPQAAVYYKQEQLWNASLVTGLRGEAEQLYAGVGLLRGMDGNVSDERLSALIAELAQPQIELQEIRARSGSIVSSPMVIGVLLLFVMLLVSQSVGHVLDDRVRHTMMRMYAAPVRSFDIALGNFAGSLVVGTLQIALGLAVLRYAFGYDAGGVPYWELLLVLECFLLGVIGLASAAAGLVRDSQQLGQLNNFIVTPTCMIGGCFWPLSIMPGYMQKLAAFTPQRWAIDAIDRLSAGMPLSDIAAHLGILLLIAAVLLSFGVAALQPSRTAS